MPTRELPDVPSRDMSPHPHRWERQGSTGRTSPMIAGEVIRDVDEDVTDQRARESEERERLERMSAASPASRRSTLHRDSSFARHGLALERKSSMVSVMSQGTPGASPQFRGDLPFPDASPVDHPRAANCDLASQRSTSQRSMSRKSTFRQTQLKNVEALKRDGIHRPLLSRDFPQAKIPSIGVIAGFINFFRCDNSITIPKPPCCDTNDEYVHLRVMTQGERDNLQSVYAEDEITNTIVLAPALLIGFLLTVVLYCGIVVFWAPHARLYEAGRMPWRGGEMNGAEALLPMAMAILYVIAITYANTLDISFTMFERQFLIEPEVLTSLQGREVSLPRTDVGKLANVQVSAKLPFVRQSIAKKVRWYHHDCHEALPADLYINYINSLAATASAKEYKVSQVTSAVNILLPLIVAIAPCSARVFTGGSLWGNGLAEEFALTICGPVLTMVCCYGIVAMLNVFAFTMKFHRLRMEWLTLALPDPTRLSESSWPTIGFDSLENVLIWHRMRSVILKPPMSLYLWGRRLSEVTFVMFVLLVILSMAYNFITAGAGNTSFDGSTALMIALLVTLAPLLMFIFYTPLHSTFLTQQQIDALSRVLMLSTKDMAMQRGAAGVTDEALKRIQDIRSALKVVMRSIASEEEVITFLGFPLSVYTMMFMAAVFSATCWLVLVRGVYGKDAFI